ncbi:MAG: TonB-dependent receptor [Lentimicrobiaceae bacterium]|nr:TonB-dependent receptor [Lentimicrobiaceae bacterium]
MLKRLYFTLGIALVSLGSAYAQSTVKGKVYDEDGKTPLEYATVRLMQEDRLIMGVVTDRKGDFSITPVPTGTYDLVVSFAGLENYRIEGLVITPNIVKIMDDITMSSTTLKIVTIPGRPLIDPGSTAVETYMDAKTFNDLAGNTIGSALATMPGVTVSGDGSISVRAQRESSTYLVDGVPTSSIPRMAISGLSLISGALPPEHGDGGSVVEIETKGPTAKLAGDIQVGTFVDGHDYVSVDGSFTGPIVTKSKEDGKKFTMGYMLSFSAVYNKGPVYWKGAYRASQETIDYLKREPFLPTEDASSSVVRRNVDYVTKYREGNILSLEEKRARQQQNAWGTSVNIRPKIDIRTPMNMDFSIGGRFTYNTGRDFDFANSLFNSENNRLSESMGWELNARFTHRLGVKTNTTANSEEKTKQSIIKNAYYRLIAYYIHGSGKSYSEKHKENLFNYGHIGTFDHVKVPSYEIGDVRDLDSNLWEGVSRQNAFQNVAVNFEASEHNPDLARYNILAEDRFGFTFPNDEYLTTYKGLLNGSTPPSAYELFRVPGVPYNGYGKSLSDRFGGKFLLTFEIGDHSIRFGFDYDQSIGRSYGIEPAGLWTMMRQLTNSHILEMDFDSPIFLYDTNGVFTNFVNFPRLVDSLKQSDFDKRIRQYVAEEMGVSIEDIRDRWIDVDSYDPSTFDLNWFNPIELFNNGSGFNGERVPSISYAGYNYLGNKTINRSISMADMKNWFNESDPYNVRNFNEIGANKQVKMAAHISDKFSIKTLHVMLGLRLDIFNLSQPYVKDMFLYREAYTVKESQDPKSDIAKKFSDNVFIPENMRNSDDYYIYVKDADAQIYDVVAFRNGRTWYDKNGMMIADPEALAREEGLVQLMPILKEKPGPTDVSKVNWKAFEDYVPKFSNGGVTLSPRIAFSFAVGDKSQFSASYNVITSWSAAVHGINPVSYLFFEKFANQSSYYFSNPGLKPERSVDYEIGFKQVVVPDKMSMEFGAYYSERKDQVVVYQYAQAYPQTYMSYTNMDFGTVQGFSLGLNLRASKSSRASFNANYTLQFAKGTGSDPTSTANLIRAGQPNLRTLTTLDNDQRHKINLMITYNFLRDDAMIRVQNKKAETFKEYRWLQNVGATLDMGVGSGFPYTRSGVPYSSIVNQGSRVVDGAINGSRMPWVITGNLNIRKGFDLALKKDASGKVEKSGHLLVGLAILNIFGFKNPTSVYSYTGSREDDGFLTSKDYQQYVATQENVASFVDFYTLYMEGLNPYGSPRRFRLDLTFSFQ